MSKNDSIKKLFKKITGFTIFKKIPFGLDPLDDIKFLFPEKKMATFFDVGANIGQTVHAIRAHYKVESIYCFEPFKKTFETLKKNTLNEKVNYYNTALAAKSGKMQVNVSNDEMHSDLNSLSSQSDTALVLSKEEIDITTLNEFCAKEKIEKINFLKIDTEGYDLEVLKGATDLLTRQSIDFIEVELGMNPENKLHVDFGEVKSYLENFHYRIFGIYNQAMEWPTDSPILRRTDVVFVSNKISRSHKLDKLGFYKENNLL